MMIFSRLDDVCIDNDTAAFFAENVLESLDGVNVRCIAQATACVYIHVRC